MAAALERAVLTRRLAAGCDGVVALAVVALTGVFLAGALSVSRFGAVEVDVAVEVVDFVTAALACAGNPTTAVAVTKI